MSKADKPEEKVALDKISWRKDYETGRVEVKTSDGWITINQDEMDGVVKRELEVDMGEKKFKEGDFVKVNALDGYLYGVFLGWDGSYKNKYRYAMIDLGERYYPCPQSVRIEGIELVAPEPKLSGEELLEAFEEMCQEQGDCKDCPFDHWNCDPTSISNMFLQFKKLIDTLPSYKAQKEQKKKIETEIVWLARIIKGEVGNPNSKKEVVAEKTLKHILHSQDYVVACEKYKEWFKNWCKDNGNPKNSYFMTNPELITRIKQD